MKTKYFLIAALLVAGQLARADILFIGFNPAEGEIRVVQKIARERGEKVFVFPKNDPALVARHSALVGERSRLTKELSRGNEARNVQISTRMNEIDKETARLEQLLEAKPDALEKELAELAAAGVKLSSVVLSGHDGNGDFWGPYGRVNNLRLTRLLQQYPALHAEVRSLALLGCYTSTVGAIETYWKNVMPSVRIVGGYDGSGPLASHSVGHRYLEEFLRRDSKLGAAKTPSDLMSMFRKLPAIRQLEAAIATREILANGEGARTIEDYYKDCVKVDTSSELRRAYDCYMSGAKGCEDPPRDTKKGVLRQFYNELHGIEHCRALLTVKGDAGLPRGREVLALIYFHSMRENFARIHAADFQKADEALAKAGLPSELFKKMGDTAVSRAALKTFIEDLRSRITLGRAELKKEPASQETFVNFSRAGRWLEIVSKIILERNGLCTPASWVDPGSGVASDCMNPRVMDSHAEREWQEFIDIPENETIGAWDTAVREFGEGL